LQVLIDERDVCKISDFGLSKSEDLGVNTAVTIAQTEYTPAWSAPEVLNSQGKSISGFCSDVYSLGIVIWEIVSGQWPFHNQTTMQILAAVGINQETPPIPENTSHAIIIMMQRCWDTIPESRVTMPELESYVTNTKEFDNGVNFRVPGSCEIIPAGEMDTIPGATQVHSLASLQDSYAETVEDNTNSELECCAKTEPQNHFLADVPELGESWPLVS